MSTLNKQAALARIYIDAGARKALRDGDSSSLTEFNLTEEDVNDLRRLVLDRRLHLEVFAGMIQNKRDQNVRSFYPILIACAGSREWRRLWTAYSHQYPAQSVLTVAEDAVRFGRFLNENQYLAEEKDGSFADALEYESTKAAVATARAPQAIGYRRLPEPQATRPLLVPPACLRTLRRDPRRLLAWSAAGATSSLGPDATPVHLLFFRHSEHNGAVAVARVGEWLASLLARSDGRTELADLVETFEATAERELLLKTTRAALAALAEQGVVAFVAAPTEEER